MMKLLSHVSVHCARGFSYSRHPLQNALSSGGYVECGVPRDRREAGERVSSGGEQRVTRSSILYRGRGTPLVLRCFLLCTAVLCHSPQRGGVPKPSRDTPQTSGGAVHPTFPLWSLCISSCSCDMPTRVDFLQITLGVEVHRRRAHFRVCNNVENVWGTFRGHLMKNWSRIYKILDAAFLIVLQICSNYCSSLHFNVHTRDHCVYSILHGKDLCVICAFISLIYA